MRYSQLRIKMALCVFVADGRTNRGRYPSKVGVLVASYTAQIRRDGAFELLTTSQRLAWFTATARNMQSCD